MTTTAHETFTICTIQPATVWGQPQRTFAHIAGLLTQATCEMLPDLVVLPEHFNAAFEEDGETTQFDAAREFAAGLARRHRVNLVAGSVERWHGDLGARVNTSVVFDREGREAGRYDKRRLFGFEKRRGVQPGYQPLRVELDGVRCGILICSDLWHPELVREMEPEIDVLCVPAQTAIRPKSEPAYARLLWHSMAMTRAQENVLVVAVSDHAAKTTGPYRCGGVSNIVDPSAEPDLAAIQRILPDGETGFLLTQINLRQLAAFREYRRQNGLLPG